MCTEFFDNKIKPKHLHKFTKITPEGHTISGYISYKENEFLGSMIIDTILTKSGDKFNTLQFIHAMPKIHYYSEDNQLNEDGPCCYECVEKLDGSCLIVYPIYDNKCNLLEIIPKTRTQPVADEFILDMYKLIDKTTITEYFNLPFPQQFPLKSNVLIFELYGILNMHTIYYPKYYINMSLIGCYSGEILENNDLYSIAIDYEFDRPKTMLYIYCTHNGDWHMDTLDPLLYKFVDDKIAYPTQKDCIDAVKSVLQEVNDAYYKEYGFIRLEGLVINGYDKDGNQMYMKIKPWDIEERCRTENGVPRRFILKEVYKYYDEYGFNVKEIYNKDKSHYYHYVIKGLSEEFSDEAINHPKTKKRIEDVFFDVMESKEPPQGLQEICQNLIEENPDLNVPELMRVFAEKYPHKKKLSRMTFSILKAIKKD